MRKEAQNVPLVQECDLIVAGRKWKGKLGNGEKFRERRKRQKGVKKKS